MLYVKYVSIFLKIKGMTELSDWVKEKKQSIFSIKAIKSYFYPQSFWKLIEESRFMHIKINVNNALKYINIIRFREGFIWAANDNIN